MSGNVPQGIMGEVITAENGEQYYIVGKNRIKITEHFSSTGKLIEELLADLITRKIKENAAKI